MSNKSFDKLGEGFCIDCGFIVNSFENLTECPKCKTKSIPCSFKVQRNISINWHELRVLVMWAESWAREKELGRTVFSIANRIEGQHPELAEELPLTLAKELGQLSKKFSLDVNSSDLRRDIAEQTGQEVGLIHRKTSHHGCSCNNPDCSYRYG